MAALCPGTIYINGCCCTFAIVVVCAVVGFTFNLDLFAATVAFHTICCCIRFFLKASTAGFICNAGAFAHNIDLTSGTLMGIIINTVGS